MVSVVVALAVPPPSGTVTVRVFWFAPRVRLGAAEAWSGLIASIVAVSTSRVRMLRTLVLSRRDLSRLLRL